MVRLFHFLYQPYNFYEYAAVSDARKRTLRVFGEHLGNCVYNKEVRAFVICMPIIVSFQHVKEARKQEVNSDCFSGE